MVSANNKYDYCKMNSKLIQNILAKLEADEMKDVVLLKYDIQQGGTLLCFKLKRTGQDTSDYIDYEVKNYEAFEKILTILKDLTQSIHSIKYQGQYSKMSFVVIPRK